MFNSDHGFVDGLGPGYHGAVAFLGNTEEILLNLGKTDAADISVDDTTDTAKIFAQTKFNGDGIIPADASDDPAVQSVITDIITCLGGEQDRSGKLGITQAKADLFFTEAAAFAGWHSKASADANVLPVGPNTAIAAAAIKAVAGKIDDYFVRCRLTSFDPRTTAAVNRLEADYVTAAAKELSLACTELTSFPLARVEAGKNTAFFVVPGGSFTVQPEAIPGAAPALKGI